MQIIVINIQFQPRNILALGNSTIQKLLCNSHHEAVNIRYTILQVNIKQQKFQHTILLAPKYSLINKRKNTTQYTYVGSTQYKQKNINIFWLGFGRTKDRTTSSQTINLHIFCETHAHKLVFLFLTLPKNPPSKQRTHDPYPNAPYHCLIHFRYFPITQQIQPKFNNLLCLSYQHKLSTTTQQTLKEFFQQENQNYFNLTKVNFNANQDQPNQEKQLNNKYVNRIHTYFIYSQKTYKLNQQEIEKNQTQKYPTKKEILKTQITTYPTKKEILKNTNYNIASQTEISQLKKRKGKKILQNIKDLRYYIHFSTPARQSTCIVYSFIFRPQYNQFVILKLTPKLKENNNSTIQIQQ
eukprot:TRINITY_DN8637_c0_g1_i6.p2 TRINITY_DN8637_c0_g1~~TRINITY_DN8637_c0_g1_i6.p2  ORF type:complete len:353 (+),score=-16.25 TRINITY_DN8637_c0_g1_i6:715-1773(+)